MNARAMVVFGALFLVTCGQDRASSKCMDVEGKYILLMTKVKDACTPDDLTTETVVVEFKKMTRDIEGCESILKFKSEKLEFDGMLTAPSESAIEGEQVGIFIARRVQAGSEVVELIYSGGFMDFDHDLRSAEFHFGGMRMRISDMFCTVPNGERSYVLTGRRAKEE